MARLDEVKEILNTLRLFFSIMIGIIVLLTGALVSKEQNNLVDIYFWIGTLIDIALLIGVIFIIKLLKKYTKQIKDL